MTVALCLPPSFSIRWEERHPLKLKWTFSRKSEPNRFALADIPDVPQDCVGDINGNGSVEFEDLLTLLSSWDSESPAADLDGSGTVEFNDLLMLLSAYGDC